MSRSFRVHLHTVASATVPVTLSDEKIDRVAESLGLDPADLTAEDLAEAARDAAYENTPTLGYCCVGGHYSWQPSLELGDDWDSDSENAVTEVTGS